MKFGEVLNFVSDDQSVIVHEPCINHISSTASALRTALRNEILEYDVVCFEWDTERMLVWLDGGEKDD